MIGSYGYVAEKLKATNILAVGWGPDVLNMPFKSPLHRYFFKKVIRGIDHFVVDAKNMVDVLISFGVEKNRITVFPYGPQEKFYIFPEKEGYAEPIKLITHRKLEPEYDPFTVVDALKDLKEEGIKFNFTFASFGSLQKATQERIREYGLSDNVRITGYLNEEDLINTLLAHDFYVSASLYDSTSVSLLEAMSLGLYPIVSDVEANLEWIHHGKNGRIFKKHDKESLKMAIKQVLNMEKEEYRRVLYYNYEVVRKTGSFRDNVLRTVKGML